MRKIERLRIQANDISNWRGHKMTKFHYTKKKIVNGIRIVGISVCIKCGYGMCIDTNPDPNGCDLSGKAISLYCKGE